MGIQIFNSVRDAIEAGYVIESLIPDSEGLLRARSGWAIALVRAREAA